MNNSESGSLVRFHLRVGWWAILFFLSVGVILEVLHGFKIGFYLDVGQNTRRLMWTLGHAHGGLFALLNIGFAATIHMQPEWSGTSRTVASGAVLTALVTVPAGFLLGGTFIHEGDPGLGVLLVPVGAAALFVGVLLTARGLTKK